MRRFLLIPTQLLLLAAPARAGIYTIDFEDQETICSQVLVRHGMRLTNLRGTFCVTDGNSANSVSNGSFHTNDMEGLTLVQTEGRSFTPLSIDLAEYSLTVTAKPILIIGHKPSGELVNFTVDLDNLRDGPGGIDDFQTVSFPAGFQDVVSVEIPGKAFAVDNIVISTIAPPPFPPGLLPQPGFSSATLLHSIDILANEFIAGSDYEYKAGFSVPNTARYRTETSSNSFSPVGSISYDAPTSTFAFTRNNSIQSFDGGQLKTLLTKQQLTDAGFPDFGLSMPVLGDGRLVFVGTNFSHGDRYKIFKAANGIITAFVDETTDLPGPSGFAKPYYFPDFLAAQGSHIAFDTSLATSRTIHRIFASFDNAPCQLIVSQGDQTPLGTLTQVTGLAFTANGHLEVTALMGYAKCRLIYNAAGLVSSQPLSLTIAPVNAGKSVSGELRTRPDEMQILDDHSAIYRKSGDQWFRVIGIGDLVDGEPITYLNFLARRRNHPDHLIVEIRGDSFPNSAHHIEIVMTPPVELPPRFGPTVVHPESGELYIPLSHLTFGRSYVVRKSSDLISWADLKTIPEILPLQHVRIPVADLGTRSFFRVEERPSIPQ